MAFHSMPMGYTVVLKNISVQRGRGEAAATQAPGAFRRAAAARSYCAALINNPDIIFADEPTGNRDSKSGTEILALLQKINREQGKTVVVVTHSEDAVRYGNRIIYVCDGAVE